MGTESTGVAIVEVPATVEEATSASGGVGEALGPPRVSPLRVRMACRE